MSTSPTDLIAGKIAAIEAALRARDVSVDALCAAAGINRSTWQRWKAGVTLPNMRAWLEVEAAAKRFDLQLTTPAEVEPPPASVMEDSGV